MWDSKPVTIIIIIDTAAATRTADASPLDAEFTAGEIADGVAALKRDKALAGFIKLEYLIIIIIVTGLESHTRCASRAHVVRLYVP